MRELGFSATPIELFPVFANAKTPASPYQVRFVYVDGDETSFKGNWRRVDAAINHNKGVLVGYTPLSNWHAVAFDNGTLFDPDGKTYDYTPAQMAANGLFPHTAWIIE